MAGYLSFFALGCVIGLSVPMVFFTLGRVVSSKREPLPPFQGPWSIYYRCIRCSQWYPVSQVRIEANGTAIPLETRFVCRICGGSAPGMLVPWIGRFHGDEFPKRFEWIAEEQMSAELLHGRERPHDLPSFPKASSKEVS